MRDEARTATPGPGQAHEGLCLENHSVVCGTAQKTIEAQVIGKQVLRSGTSVGAHYREARRAKSDADFISKIEGALQELDETVYWLELLSESGMVKPDRLKPLTDECENSLICLSQWLRTSRVEND